MMKILFNIFTGVELCDSIIYDYLYLEKLFIVILIFEIQRYSV